MGPTLFSMNLEFFLSYHMFRCEVSVCDQSACIHIRQAIYNVFTMCGFKESRFEPTDVGLFLYTFFTTVWFFLSPGNPLI